MRKSLLLMLILAIPVLMLAGAQYKKMNVKTGLWEVTRTHKMSGEVPPALLERLSPEQRARVQAQMQAQSGKPETSTYKSCINQKELDEGADFGNKPEQCSETLVSSTTNHVEVRFDCEMEGMKGTGTYKVDAISPERVQGSDEIRAEGSNNIVSSSTFTAKWIGPNCGDTK